jgi:hypothetical protein
MFQIGAINPNVGDQRRQQLLQTLAQQFVQRQGAGVPGEPGLPMFAFNRKRTPVFGNANKVNPSLRSGRTDMTNASPIPDTIAKLLGPGGFGSASANVMSPAAGMPIPGMGRPGALLPTSSAPAGNTAPAATPPPAAAPTQSGAAANALLNPPNAGSLYGNSNLTPAQIASNQGVANTNPGNAQVTPAMVAQANAAPAGARSIGGAMVTTPSGMVPLGNGVFFNPATGAISGMGPTPFGGGGARSILV